MSAHLLSGIGARVPTAAYGTTGLAQWIRDNVVTVVILLLACAILWAAKSGNIAKGVTILAGMLIGLAALGLATGTNAQDIGTFLVNLIKG